MNIYLSPHLDDVVLSCGGRLWAERAAGAAPRVIGICAGIPDYARLPPFAALLHMVSGNPPAAVELRRAEDTAALARLGVLAPVYLDYLDCIYRVMPDGRTPYDSEQAIFGDLDAGEAGLAAQLAGDLAARLPPAAACEVVAPLGAGHHVDHLLVHAAARELERRGYRVAYYEEQPYVVRGQLDAALADKPGWTVTALPLDETALDAKLEAIAYYRTQVPVLFGGEEGMRAALRENAASVAPAGHPYGERVWCPPSGAR